MLQNLKRFMFTSAVILFTVILGFSITVLSSLQSTLQSVLVVQNVVENCLSENQTASEFPTLLTGVTDTHYHTEL